MDWPLILIIILIFLGIFVVGVVLPKATNSDQKVLAVAVKGLIDDYFIAHTDSDLEKRRLRFHQLAIASDRVLGKTLMYYGCRDSSVKQQMRIALQKNIITYDQFQTLKRFHHMRNEIVHEGLQINGENETVVYGALLVLKAMLGI